MPGSRPCRPCPPCRPSSSRPTKRRKHHTRMRQAATQDSELWFRAILRPFQMVLRAFYGFFHEPVDFLAGLCLLFLDVVVFIFFYVMALIWIVLVKIYEFYKGEALTEKQKREGKDKDLQRRRAHELRRSSMQGRQGSVDTDINRYHDRPDMAIRLDRSGMPRPSIGSDGSRGPRRRPSETSTRHRPDGRGRGRRDSETLRVNVASDAAHGEEYEEDGIHPGEVFVYMLKKVFEFIKSLFRSIYDMAASRASRGTARPAAAAAADADAEAAGTSEEEGGEGGGGVSRKGSKIDGGSRKGSKIDTAVTEEAEDSPPEEAGE